MSTSDNHEETKKIPPFHKRFNVPIEIDEARQRFMNRCYNEIPSFLQEVHTRKPNIHRLVATELGADYSAFSLGECLRKDFYTCLRTLEAIYSVLREMEQTTLSADIRLFLYLAEIDLGVIWSWQEGVFWKSGAKLLDDELVNEPLQWLSDAKYKSVLAPFKKGLSDFLLATKETERHKDVVTEMYEALEAMSKVVCNNGKDLSANRESFVDKLGLSEYYEKMLKDFIRFGCEFRHGEGQAKPRIKLTAQEVEAFVYMTGLFIRLAIERLGA